MPELPEDDFVQSLKADLSRAQRRETEPTEDLSHRSELNQRNLQDLWEIHNQFENLSVHLTVEPSQTLFATFVGVRRSGRSSPRSILARSRRSSSRTEVKAGSGSPCVSGRATPPGRKAPLPWHLRVERWRKLP